MNEHEDRPLSELYQQAEDVTYPSELDDKILAMAKLHAAENQPKPWFQVQRFGAIASACVVVIAVSVIFIQPNTELPLNEEPQAMSPSPRTEPSSFAAPSPEIMTRPIISTRMKAMPARQAAAKETLQVARSQEIIVASPEYYLDSIEQLIEENKLTAALLGFNNFERQYPQLAQFKKPDYALTKLKKKTLSRERASEEFAADRELTHLMGVNASSGFADTLVEESEFSTSSSAELKMTDQAHQNVSLQARVNAIISVLTPLLNQQNE